MTDATLTTNLCVGNTAVFNEYMIPKYKLQNFVRSVWGIRVKKDL